MRMYEDPICVLFDGRPRQFIWRDRLLLVKKVESRWSRATAWWESERIRAARSTMVFVNSRRLAERLATALNETAEEEIALDRAAMEAGTD